MLSEIDVKTFDRNRKFLFAEVERAKKEYREYVSGMQVSCESYKGHVPITGTDTCKYCLAILTECYYCKRPRIRCICID